MAAVSLEQLKQTVPQSIDDPSHPVAKRLADVLRSRSEKPRTFVLDDPENIAQAVACGIELDSVYFSASANDPKLTGVDPGVPRYCLSESVIQNLFGTQKHSRIFTLARTPKKRSLGELAGGRGDILILDGVRIVGNIGAIIRTACALGAAGVVVINSGLSTIVDRRLVRASRGLVFAMPVVLTTRAECIAFVRQKQLALATLSASATEPLSSIRTVRERLALVLGGEREGLSRELDALATHRYAILMASGVESLNVSVTAGIALYEHAVSASH
ncbi:NshR/TsnR family 23S rRNA methyltransferase [Leucobacter insecticola]|uniref:NshR/TsnR family 23S rRNA methyltransferase n=1 Tax=Leucobacter insecticola TaxID=2714934 RepID=A0A6G8FK47_9MICO|nr:TrmH family RNA methyltransferase [Leucobacter insecticola]QIM16724.1 NshR/TsnR family 23S rRNA methyltransferase [Leucobacter insecticola]